MFFLVFLNFLECFLMVFGGFFGVFVFVGVELIFFLKLEVVWCFFVDFGKSLWMIWWSFVMFLSFLNEFHQ